MSDRSALIRLASSLPKGSEERRAILSGIAKIAIHPDWDDDPSRYDTESIEDSGWWSEFQDALDDELRKLGFREKRVRDVSVEEYSLIRDFEYTGRLGDFDFTTHLEVDPEVGSYEVRLQVEEVSWLKNFSNRDRGAEAVGEFDEVLVDFRKYLEEVVSRHPKGAKNRMARSLTASDRKNLIRLASSMEKGSPERKAILAGLLRESRRGRPTLRSLGDELDAILDDIADLDSEAKRMFRVASRGYLERSFQILDGYEAKEAELLAYQKKVQDLMRLSAREDLPPLEAMLKKSKKALRGLKIRVGMAQKAIKTHKKEREVLYLVVGQGASIGPTDLQIGDIVQKDRYEGDYGWGNYNYKGYGFKAYGTVHPIMRDSQYDPGYPDPRLFRTIKPQKAKRLLEQGKVPSAQQFPSGGKTMTLSEMMPLSSGKGSMQNNERFLMWGLPARGGFPEVEVKTYKSGIGGWHSYGWRFVASIGNDEWHLLENKRTWKKIPTLPDGRKHWKNMPTLAQTKDHGHDVPNEALRMYPKALKFLWDAYFSKHPELGVTGP